MSSSQTRNADIKSNRAKGYHASISTEQPEYHLHGWVTGNKRYALNLTTIALDTKRAALLPRSNNEGPTLFGSKSPVDVGERCSNVPGIIYKLRRIYTERPSNEPSTTSMSG